MGVSKVWVNPMSFFGIVRDLLKKDFDQLEENVNQITMDLKSVRNLFYMFETSSLASSSLRLYIRYQTLQRQRVEEQKRDLECQVIRLNGSCLAHIYCIFPSLLVYSG